MGILESDYDELTTNYKSRKGIAEMKGCNRFGRRGVINNKAVVLAIAYVIVLALSEADDKEQKEDQLGKDNIECPWDYTGFVGWICDTYQLDKTKRISSGMTCYDVCVIISILKLIFACIIMFWVVIYFDNANINAQNNNQNNGHISAQNNDDNNGHINSGNFVKKLKKDDRKDVTKKK